MSENEIQPASGLQPISMEATQRIIEAAGLGFPRGVDEEEHCQSVYRALNFVAQYVAISKSWFDAEAEQDRLRQKLDSLDAEFRTAERTGDQKGDRENDDANASTRTRHRRKIEALEVQKKKRPKSRPKEFSTHILPWLLGLYELCFGEKPTASYDPKNGTYRRTSGFVHAALKEISEIVPELTDPLGPSVQAALSETPSRRLVINIPTGDSLRKAIERALKDKESPASKELIPETSPPGRPRRVWIKCRNFLKENHF
ncbi:hypothetical protein [Silicimonas sp. MF1-12-2]|uniref:hypothetical protein n=1 Tax=Silicimonas sp. MF1-12-2 TaxID=3384793 RepID=UPI0039B5A579